jgi:hypothetical protein
MGLRYAGQEGTLTLLDATTQEELLASIGLESIMFAFPMELTETQFLGDNEGPEFREFPMGYELEFKFQPNDAAQLVAYANLIRDRAQGKPDSNHIFAAQVRFASPDGPTLQVTFADLHWEGLPFDMGGRTNFLTGTHRCKGKKYKIQVI